MALAAAWLCTQGTPTSGFPTFAKRIGLVDYWSKIVADLCQPRRTLARTPHLPMSFCTELKCWNPRWSACVRTRAWPTIK